MKRTIGPFFYGLAGMLVVPAEDRPTEGVGHILDFSLCTM